MEKIITTSWSFPLIKLNVNIKYAEIQKPSGVGYIILVLIKDANNRDEMLGKVLERFGVPDDLQFIFADEIEVLLSRGILQLTNNNDYQREYFEEYTIGSFAFTGNGERMFREGAIPTGEEKGKQITVYFNPLIGEFSFDISAKHTTIEKAECYPQGFMERVETDLSGLKEFLIDNGRKAGLQKEERLLDCAIAEREDWVTTTDNSLEVRIDEDGMEVGFKTAGAAFFYEKYFTPDMLERGFDAKTKFKFGVPTTAANGFNDFKNLLTVYLPEDYKTQINRPVKMLLTKDAGKISVKHGNTVTTFENGETIASAASALFPDWSFITIDGKEMRYYTAARVTLTERVLKKPSSLNLLVEQQFHAEQKAKVIKAIFDESAVAAFSTEYINLVKSVYELTNDASRLTCYISDKLKNMNDKATQAEILLTANRIFPSIEEWRTAVLKHANEIYNELISGMTKENVGYTVKIARTLDVIRKPNKDELLRTIAKKFDGLDEVALFNIITGADFTENEALAYANVIKVYIDKILAGETDFADSAISDGFAGVADNLNDLKDNLGIRSTVKYAFRESYKIDKFIEDYRAFKSKIDSLKKYSNFAQEGFAELYKYVKIMQPVFDSIMIERNASKNPAGISEKYIRKNIEDGKWHDAIVYMVIRLEYVINKLLKTGKDDTSKLFENIDRAYKEGVLTKQQADILHELRIFRNKIIHPTEEKLDFDREKITKWADAVFAVPEKPEKKEEKK